MENYYKTSGAAGQRLHEIGQKQYGATIAHKKRRHAPLNCAAILLCLFMPLVLFGIMYAVMSFSIRYEHKLFSYFLVFLGLVIVLMTAKLAMDAVSKQSSEGSSDATWFIFLAAACAIAWIAGVVLGDLNYFYNMEPFYDVRNLNYYPHVDPSHMSGQQVMDAGRLTFVPGSTLDLAKSMAFRSADLYCVAPIVNTMSNTTLISYDFWAVGLNCCKGPGAFMCGEYTNTHASSGLRVMRDDQCAFYRLAVQQAEATHNIKANHPLFLYWMQDPVAEVNAYRDEGLKYFLFGLLAFFAFLLASIIAAIVFTSTSHTMKENRRRCDKSAPVHAFLPPQKDIVTSHPRLATAVPYLSSPPVGFGGAPVAMQSQASQFAMYDNNQVTTPEVMQAAPFPQVATSSSVHVPGLITDSQVPLSKAVLGQSVQTSAPSIPVRSNIISAQAAPEKFTIHSRSPSPYAMMNSMHSVSSAKTVFIPPNPAVPMNYVSRSRTISPAPSNPRSRSSSPGTFVRTSVPHMATRVITSQLQPWPLPSMMPKVIAHGGSATFATGLPTKIVTPRGSAVRSRSV